MTENKFDLLTAKVDEAAKDAETFARLMRRFTEVIQSEGLYFDEVRSALYQIWSKMNDVTKEIETSSFCSRSKKEAYSQR